MPSAMSGENIKLTRPICHELWKMVLSSLFSCTISYIERPRSVRCHVHVSQQPNAKMAQVGTASANRAVKRSFIPVPRKKADPVS